MTHAYGRITTIFRAGRAASAPCAAAALGFLALLLAGFATAQGVAKTRAPARPAPVAPAASETSAPAHVIIPRQVAVPAPAAPVAPAQDASPAPSPARISPVPSAGTNPIEGTYSVPGSAARIRVSHIARDFYELSSSDGWEGVGILDGMTYRGVFRQRVSTVPPQTVTGEHVIDWREVNSPAVHIRVSGPPLSELDVRWQRAAAGPGHRPAFGEYVYVELLPEVITRVAPVYPDAAREAGVDGTVQVQALVIEDGSVADCQITRSIPQLDAVAIAAVRQWRFRPAQVKGQPVAVWVAVPVKFTLH